MGITELLHRGYKKVLRHQRKNRKLSCAYTVAAGTPPHNTVHCFMFTTAPAFLQKKMCMSSADKLPALHSYMALQLRYRKGTAATLTLQSL